MSPRTTGNLIFVAALGAVLLGLSTEIKGLHDWPEALTPAFVGQTMWHIGSVIGAYVGGRLIPARDEPPHRPPRSV